MKRATYTNNADNSKYIFARIMPLCPVLDLQATTKHWWSYTVLLFTLQHGMDFQFNYFMEKTVKYFCTPKVFDVCCIVCVAFFAVIMQKPRHFVLFLITEITEAIYFKL